MNTNKSELEDQLRALRPVAPSSALEEKIARQLAPTARRQRATGREASPFFARIFFPGLSWSFAGAAAAVAIVAGMDLFRHPPASPDAAPIAAVEPDFEAEDITHELVNAEDGGVIYEDAQEPARVVRYTTLEHHVWTHPLTGARLEVEVPREDIILMPVAMQ